LEFSALTNLVLTTIGILVTAAAALMVVFYGGDAYYSGQAKSEASRLTVEGAQIQQAISNYTVRYGKVPGNRGNSEAVARDLIDAKFLDAMPPGSNGPWVIDYSNRMIRSDVGSVNDEDARRICLEARRQQSLPEPDMVYRCDGSDHPGGSLPSNEPCCTF
tara:strand:+ start:2892 stop:3374 length:483 start_codon:yes stop_codon:yes gene_type:complete